VSFFTYDNSEHKRSYIDDPGSHRSCRLCSMFSSGQLRPALKLSLVFHVLEWATSTQDEWIAKPEHDDMTRLFLPSESGPTSCTMCTTCC
jgi:hypothetical protein